MANSTQNPQYSWIYQKLTENDGDDFVLVNNIAYVIYKRKKIEFYEEKNGTPSDDELRTFHEIYSMPLGLDGLRNEAKNIVSQILNESLKDQIQDVEARLEATLTAEMKGTLTRLDQTISTNHSTTDSKLNKLTEKDWGWWASNILTGVIITFISTIIFWFGAYAYLGKSMFGNYENAKTPTISAPNKSGQNSN